MVPSTTATNALGKATSAWFMATVRGMTLISKRCRCVGPARGPAGGDGSDDGGGDSGGNGLE
jgi:hypothetical protein